MSTLKKSVILQVNHYFPRPKDADLRYDAPVYFITNLNITKKWNSYKFDNGLTSNDAKIKFFMKTETNYLYKRISRNRKTIGYLRKYKLMLFSKTARILRTDFNSYFIVSCYPYMDIKELEMQYALGTVRSDTILTCAIRFDRK